jgi:hypothetical protein
MFIRTYLKPECCPEIKTANFMPREFVQAWPGSGLWVRIPLSAAREAKHSLGLSH